MASNVGDLGGPEVLDVVANPLKMSDDDEETDDNIFIKTADTLGAADILEAVVDGLNPSAGGQDWVITDLSVDGILGTALFGLCANLGLSSCKSNLAQTTLIVVTYVALTEFAQHALGIGTGFAKIDFNGIALAQISKKVDELLVNVGKLMREPLNSAKYGLEQSLIYFQFGDITQALDLLKEVRSNATKALSTLDTSGDEDQRVKDLVLATQLLIFAAIVPESLATTDKGKVLVPPCKLSETQRKKISQLVTYHLEKLQGLVEKNKPSWLKKLFTLSYEQKEEARQDELDQVFMFSYPLLATTTTSIDKETVQVQLPSLKFIPEGWEDSTHTILTGPDGSKSKLCLWSDLNLKTVELRYAGFDYSARLSDQSVTTLVLTIKQGKIVKINTGDHTVTKQGGWSPADMREVCCLVTSKDIARVEQLGLWGHTYSLPDIMQAVQILPACRKLWVDLSCLPAGMGVEHWQAVRDGCGQVEELMFYNCMKGSEREVGKVMARVEKIWLLYVEFGDLGAFCNAFVEEVGEKEARCREVEFRGSTARKYKAELVILARRLGWRVAQEEKLCIVIRK